MVKNIDQAMCIISINEYTIIRVAEAIICSMVFNVKQYRIKFKRFNDVRDTRDQAIEYPIDKYQVSYFPAMFKSGEI